MSDNQTLEFTPIEYDAETLPPEAQPGSYEARCSAVKVTKTNKDSYPMVVVEWTLDKAITGSDESEGATVADFVTFFPANHKAGRMSVRRLRELLDAVGIEPSVIPNQLRAKSDFDELVDALTNKEITVYLSLRADKRTGQERVAISYTPPMGALSNGSTADDDDSPAPTTNRSTKTAAKPTAKKNGRR